MQDLNQTRTQRREKLTEKTYDLLVIGGGITGSGIALDAVTRGLSVALIEKQDFAAGTSSRSTKLIHGGLRYLKQWEFKLVREVGSERAIVHRLAPHLVVPEKMLLPIIENGSYSKSLTSLGLTVYDLLAGVKKADRRKMLSKTQTLGKEPLLNDALVKGGGLYAEYRTDDARLTISLVKTAAKHGAQALNYVEAREFLYTKTSDTPKICGAVCHDSLSDLTFEIRAHQVVNAAGPWVDELREINRSLEGKHLHLTKGVHIVVPHHKFPVQQSVYFDVPGKRMLFAIPRGKITYIGTTDTDYHGDKAHPRTRQEDVEYLIRGIDYLFPEVQLKREDVISSWAGIRPLIHETGKSASEISRKDEIFVSSTGLISIAGGKLTGYRKMAQRVVDKVLDRHPAGAGPCRTHKITLLGGDFDGYPAVKDFTEGLTRDWQAQGLSPEWAKYLVANYGTQAREVLTYLTPQNSRSLDAALELAELRFCLENEWVQKPMDFFNRRTGQLYFDIERVRAFAAEVLAVFEKAWGWDPTTLAEERRQVEEAVYHASHFAPAERETEHVHTLEKVG